MEKIPPLEYSGSVVHFRAWMDRFLAVNGQICTLRKGTKQEAEYRISYFTPARAEAREVWNVFPIINGRVDGRRFAMILATENHLGITSVDFLDGQCYERTGYGYRSPAAPPAPPPTLSDAYLASHDPIGDDFIQLAENIRLHFEQDHQNDIEIPPWEKIPNVHWYRNAAKLWHEGYSNDEIAGKLNKSSQTVRNKIAELRNLYGEEAIPYRRKQKST